MMCLRLAVEEARGEERTREWEGEVNRGKKAALEFRQGHIKKPEMQEPAKCVWGQNGHCVGSL